MTVNRERRMLLAGIGAVGAMAVARTARAATCGDSGPLSPTGPTMRDLSTKIAFTDDGIAEARTPITSCPSSATALYVIGAPGVYYMTGNITGEPGKSAIEVTADNVEIECDGFMFLGNGATRSCITTPGSQRCIGVYDAGFSLWQGSCIDFSNSVDCYIEECSFVQCDASSSPVGGCCVLGDGGIVDDCNVLSCTHGLVSVGDNGVIEECVSRDSTGGAFSSNGKCVFEDNFALNNDAFGIAASAGSTIINSRICTCPMGLRVSSDSMVSDNDIQDCSSVAILVDGARCTIEENHISGGALGITVSSLSSRVLVDGNHVSGSSGAGISTDPGSSRCLVVRNVVSPPAPGSGFSLSGSNSWGTVVNAIAAGDLGGSGTVLDPWSNFES
jgi:hypothetical protein